MSLKKKVPRRMIPSNRPEEIQVSYRASSTAIWGRLELLAEAMNEINYWEGNINSEESHSQRIGAPIGVPVQEQLFITFSPATTERIYHRNVIPYTSFK